MTTIVDIRRLKVKADFKDNLYRLLRKKIDQQIVRGSEWPALDRKETRRMKTERGVDLNVVSCQSYSCCTAITLPRRSWRVWIIQDRRRSNSHCAICRWPCITWLRKKRCYRACVKDYLKFEVDIEWKWSGKSEVMRNSRQQAVPNTSKNRWIMCNISTFCVTW